MPRTSTYSDLPLFHIQLTQMLSFIKLCVLSFAIFSPTFARPINAGRSPFPPTLLGHRLYALPAPYAREIHRYTTPPNDNQDQNVNPISPTSLRDRFSRFSSHIHTHPSRNVVSRGSSDIVNSALGATGGHQEEIKD